MQDTFYEALVESLYIYTEPPHVEALETQEQEPLEALPQPSSDIELT